VIGNSALHYARIVAGLDEPQTQTTKAERETLASFLPGTKRIVEIGVFEGFTTRMLAERVHEVVKMMVEAEMATRGEGSVAQ
jgi:predicted O-methyltransferase YrrM